MSQKAGISQNSVRTSKTSKPIPRDKHLEFRDLVLEHHRSVRCFLARYIFCPELVEDVAQEVFLTAFRQLDQFRGDSQPSTWLLGIARNKALHFLRKELTFRNRQQQAIAARAIQTSLDRLDRACELDTQEFQLQALEDCIQQLPEDSRKLIRQFYFDRRTSNSIAEATDSKAGAVRMKLKRIRDGLRKCIAIKLQRRNQFSDRAKQ